MREKSAYGHFYSWVPGIVVLAVFAMVYAIDGFFPFGTGSVAALDLNTQYLPLLYKFYDVVKGTGGVTIDYHIAGGMNLYAEMLTELANPFNYILLFFKRDQLYLAVNLLPALYGAAASVTAAYAVNRVSEKKSFLNIVLSVCYGLSFFNAYQYEIIRWMYPVVLFPLFVLSLKRLLEEEKFVGYTLFLAYQLFLSLQLGFQTCLFTLCAAICYMLYLRAGLYPATASGDEDVLSLKKSIGRKCLILGTATVAAVMISAGNVLPALYNILHSGRFRENQPLIFVIAQHGLDDILERFLEIGHPVVFGVLAGILILHRKTVGRYMRLFFLLLFSTVILQPSNLLWHLGYYQCFPVRYGYMILLMLIFAAARGSDGAESSASQKDVPEVSDSAVPVAAFSVLLSLGVLWFAAAKRLMFSYAFATLAISRVCLKETLLFYLMMLLLAVSAAAAYILYERTQNNADSQIHQLSKCMLLIAAISSGAVCYLCVLFPQGFEARSENEAAYRIMGELGNAPASYSETGHTNDEESLLLNAPLVSGEYSLTAYMPAGADMGFSEAMDALGYASPWVSVRSEGGTVISDVLLGIHTPDAPDNGLQNGILLSGEAYGRLTEELKTDSPVSVQKAILEAMCSETSFVADDIVEVWSEDVKNTVIRPDAFRAMCSELSAKNQRILEPDERHGKLHVRSEVPMKGVLLLPFAYLEGYRAENSGTVRVSSYLDGLMSVHMTEPVTEVILAFHYDALNLAYVISLTGICLLVSAWLLFKSGPAAFLLTASEVLFNAVAILFLVGVYVAPNLGMAGYMTAKLFGVDVLAKYRAEQTAVAGQAPVLLQAGEEEDGIHVVVAGSNLVTSLHARLTADSAESGDFRAGKAGDGVAGNASSRWSSENDWENASHYLQADLRSRQTIRALRIFWFQTNAKEYDILVSDDRSFADSTVAASFTNAPADKEQVIYLERPMEARYLRVAVKDVRKEEEDLSLYYQNISIEELEIYGDDSESFVIEKPVLQGGSGRVVPIPEVPEGYGLSVGGINYENLLIDGAYFADTYAPVNINLGYVLTSGGVSFDLPGMDVVLPASDGEKTADALKTPGGFEVCGVTVREWRAAGGTCSAHSVHPTDRIDEALQKELGEEGYRIEIAEEEITLCAAAEKGLCWAHITLEQMMRQKEELPCGIIRDYPAYPVRGFCIDVARRPIRIEMLYDIVDVLSARKMNTLQLHLNDNAIIAESEYDGTLEGARSLYGAFRLESDVTGENGEPLTAADLYYTKEEFRLLTEYALLKGVEIVPEIDTPAHSLAFTRIMPSLGCKNDPETADMLDISNPDTIDFIGELWGEYLSGKGSTPPVFENCKTLHLGMDEYYGKPAFYEAYLNELTARVREMTPDKKLRVWGSLSAIGVDARNVPQELEWMLWSTYWADPAEMYDAGFKIINCLNNDLYIIVGGGTDRLDREELARNWQPNRFADGSRDIMLPAWSDRMLGACYSLWNDHYTKGIDDTTDAGLMERICEPLDMIAAKLW